jgi:hypothetical protein
MTPLEQIQEKILKLGDMLEQQLPGFPLILRDIHKQLKTDEEIVTLLSEAEIGVIVSGLSAQTKVHITETATKSVRTKAIKNITLADL